MNIISWRRPGGVKSKIDSFLANYDVVGLRKYLVNNNLLTDYTVEDYFYSMFSIHVDEFFQYFDDNGKVVGEHKEVMYFPKVMDFLCCVDSSIRDSYSELENKLFDYFHKTSMLDTKDSAKYRDNLKDSLLNLLAYRKKIHLEYLDEYYI